MPENKETVRTETLGELADRMVELIEEHGEDTPVRTNADSVVLPSVATTYEPDEDRVVFH